MDRRTTILTAVIVVCLAVAVALFARGAATGYGDNDANFPDGVHYICEAPDCGFGFHMTMKELGAYHKAHYGQPIACPKCGKTDTTRAEFDEPTGQFWRINRDGRYGEPVTKTP